MKKALIMKFRRNSLFILLFSLFSKSLLFASPVEPFDVDLWEKGLPNTNGIDTTSYDDAKSNFKPSIRVFLPAKEIATGRAIVVCPGGGYSHLAFNHEGYDWAPFFNQQGIALIVLKYRMPHGNKDVPISDAEEAIRIVRENAAKWNINPSDVGIMGFSAGGHLASTIATHAKPGTRPDFQILFYPVITMDKTYTHKGSREHFLGNNTTPEMENLYSNEKQVTQDTPRAFIVLSDDDKVVVPANGVNYYLALNKNNVPASLHIYPSGGHGWGYRDSFTFKNEMLNELRVWLEK